MPPSISDPPPSDAAGLDLPPGNAIPSSHPNHPSSDTMLHSSPDLPPSDPTPYSKPDLSSRGAIPSSVHNLPSSDPTSSQNPQLTTEGTMSPSNPQTPNGNATPSSTPDLPPSDSPTLRLDHPTEDEKTATWMINGEVWRGQLSLPTYLRREVHLANQPFTKEGGITYWVLVDTSPSTNPRTILASCETLRKRALISRNGQQVQEVISHGIGSVFCYPAYREKGFARRMLVELGKVLDTWQQHEGNKANFTVLFSDIGKQFYANLGWKAYPSSHISLAPAFAEGEMTKPFPETTLIRADDLAELCRLNEEYMKADMKELTGGSSNTRVALIPDAQTMQWHHAREEFAAKEMYNRTPDIKGIMVQGEDPGERVWCIWTRTYGTIQSENTLNILRFVIEGVTETVKQGSDVENTEAALDALSEKKVQAATLVFKAAQHEAAKWGMRSVQVWNPTHLCVLAAQRIRPKIKVIHRDEESITSLRWHGEELGEGVEVEWVGNEMYGWC